MKETNINLELPLWQLTAGQLLDLISCGTQTKVTIEDPIVKIVDTTADDKRYVYGLSGIAKLFGCSKTTANRLKQSGKIDQAIFQYGNKIIVDADKALALIKVNGKRTKK
ncbi:MAG: DUF3853 family protein [Bacteroidales bacterium]|jgi:hypothetical protein|nr:DUF3853 family protein [Bacteroidales bacterium]